MTLRQLTSRVSALTLLVPQVRDSQFSTELFARYQRSKQALVLTLVLTLVEMVVNDVSTRKVARLAGGRHDASRIPRHANGLPATSICRLVRT